MRTRQTTDPRHPVAFVPLIATSVRTDLASIARPAEGGPHSAFTFRTVRCCARSTRIHHWPNRLYVRCSPQLAGNEVESCREECPRSLRRRPTRRPTGNRVRVQAREPTAEDHARCMAEAPVGCSSEPCRDLLASRRTCSPNLELTLLVLMRCIHCPGVFAAVAMFIDPAASVALKASQPLPRVGRHQLA
jgi:hypothetical protein